MFKKFIIILIVVLSITSCSFSQVKYWRENKKIIAATVSYSQLQYEANRSNGYGGQINFTSNGRIGIGLGYTHSYNGVSSNGIGLSLEGAILRPFPKTGIGINILGAAILSFANTLVWSYPTTSGYSTENTTIQTGSIGVELYYHTSRNGFEVEPFLEFIRSFSSASVAMSSVKSSISFYNGGLDIIIPTSKNNFLVLTGGATATNKNQSSLNMAITFGFLLN